MRFFADTWEEFICHFFLELFSVFGVDQVHKIGLIIFRSVQKQYSFSVLYLAKTQILVHLDWACYDLAAIDEVIVLFGWFDWQTGLTFLYCSLVLGLNEDIIIL